jgi:uncharacterized protein with von Willebrand factor type A (vWA) domain
MPWRGHNAPHCKVCGGHRDDVGRLSARYKCASCGKRREQENLDQLRAHRGPYFEAWRRAGFTEAVQGLVDIGLMTEKQRQRALDEFDAQAQVIAARYDLFPQRARRPNSDKTNKPPDPRSTERQRAVGAEIRQHYRRPRRNFEQGVFLAAMNMRMQQGTQRSDAEEAVVASLRRDYPDFTPLRA